MQKIIYKYFKINITEFLTISVLISVILTHLIDIPYIRQNIQLTELLFLMTVGYLATNYKEIKFPKFGLLDNSFAFLVIILIINYFNHQQPRVAIMVIESIYVILLYFVFSILLLNISKERLYRILGYASEIAFWILTFAGFLGLLLYFFNFTEKFVLKYDNYPYFGDVFRIKGFSYSPNLYISVICFFVCLLKSLKRLSLNKILLIFIIALLSLTKEAILLISILIIFSLDKFITKLYFKKLILAFFGIMYLVLSLFYISFKANEDVFNNKSLLIDEPIISNNGINVYGTTYFAVLKSGYLIFKDNSLTGIGINNFQSELKNLVKKNYYPEKFELYRPTDSYLGIASELGFLYILFLILLFYAISKIVRITNDVNSHPLILLLIYFLFESVCLGSFHFRHYYIFFAILPFLLKHNKQKIETSHI